MLYELLYIVPATMTDEDVGLAEVSVKELLEKYGASFKETKRLGKFRFAYPIKQVRHGHYILSYFETEPANVSKINEALRISKNVLRHLILRAAEAGGEKFDLVQFTEVNVDTQEDKQRRKRERELDDKKRSAAEVIRSGVEALESEVKGSEKPVETSTLTDEELDKKLAAALEGDAKSA